MIKKKLVVIGGGASGFFCAVNAAKFNPLLDVIILEKSQKILSKVKVSGGGRCNVTHSCFSIASLVKNYPRGENFLKKAFHNFSPSDTINWFSERNISLKTEEDGRMFPVTNSSQTIIDCFIRDVNKYDIGIKMNAEVKQIKKVDSKFYITLSDQEILIADYVCIACGGFSKSHQFDWIKMLDHTIDDPVPSLFTFNVENHPLKELMGISLKNVGVKIAGTKFNDKGSLLITHWGLSGPVVLKLSAFAAVELAEKSYNFLIILNWLPDFNEISLLERFKELRLSLASQRIINKNPFYLPNRLWEFFLKQVKINELVRWADLPAKQQNILIKILCANEFKVKGKTTFKEEFVTAGGVKLNEIDSNTMESKIVSNLFFAGEIMNADGVTGGFNFQHAWTSAWIAARSIAGITL